nr:hypothetical protein GCM10020063_041590 [Dactylosporangium thailandense]
MLGRRLRLTAVHRDGHEFPVECTLTATGTASGWLVPCVRASRGLTEAPSSAAAASRVVEALGARMSWTVAEVWLVDEQR